MATFYKAARTAARGFGAGAAFRRGLATASAGTARRAGAGVGALLAGAALATGGYRLYKNEGGLTILPQLMAAPSSTPQPSVIGEGKTFSVYIWIHLKPGVNVAECAKVAASLQQKVKVLSPTSDEDDAILAGVGFGPAFYKQATAGAGAPLNYYYAYRKGAHGEMPSTGGDIFIHAKSNNYSKLFELTQTVVRSFPAGTIQKAEDYYGWTFQEGRDLSGFIDGTENPAAEEDRLCVAVNSLCGGSYCVTQRWIHQHDVIQNSKDKALESFIGRGKADSVELKNKTISSHVARMVGTTTPGQPKPFELVRHSQPYGTVCGESGLFFIGYAASPDNLNYMLDRMVGADKDGQSDDIMRLTKCVSGTYWYFPSQQDLKKLA